MRLLLLFLFLLSPAWAGIGAFSDTSISQQGVGFRSTITVTKYCLQPTDPRPGCVTGAKGTLYRDQSGVQNLSNPFQSEYNGRFTFYVAAGWYDVMVSGLGISAYSYRVYVTDGTVTVTGAASGDLCGFYPSPVVCGLLNHPLPAASQLAEGVVPAYNFATSTWSFRIPIYSLPLLGGDVTGAIGTNTVKKIWNRTIVDSTPALNYTILFNGTNWVYGPVPASAVKSNMTFNVCNGVECQPASNVTNPYIVTSVTVSIDACYIAGRVAPTGQNLIIDVLKNGTSIFPSGNGNKLNLTPSGGVEAITGLAVTGANLDVFTVNIIQVGSGFHAQDITVSCRMLSQ